MPALKPEMNRVLDSFVNRVFARFNSGNIQNWPKPDLYLVERRQQGTQIETRIPSASE
jgi:hypothetical protein